MLLSLKDIPLKGTVRAAWQNINRTLPQPTASQDAIDASLDIIEGLHIDSGMLHACSPFCTFTGVFQS